MRNRSGAFAAYNIAQSEQAAKRRERFLEEYQRQGGGSMAPFMRLQGVNKTVYQRWRRENPDWAARVDEVKCSEIYAPPPGPTWADTFLEAYKRGGDRVAAAKESGKTWDEVSAILKADYKLRDAVAAIRAEFMVQIEDGFIQQAIQGDKAARARVLAVHVPGYGPRGGKADDLGRGSSAGAAAERDWVEKHRRKAAAAKPPKANEEQEPEEPDADAWQEPN